MPTALVEHHHNADAGPSSGNVSNNGGHSSDEDWLMSDDEHEGKEIMYEHDEDADTTLTMANRDSAKVQRVFYDTGYREGITSGKLSTLQGGFDEGFNSTAPLARARGVLRGQASAVQIYLTEYSAQKMRGARSRNTTTATNTSTPALNTCRKLLTQIDAMNTETLLEPDWEAKQHEAEHAGEVQKENDPSMVYGESDEQRRARVGRLNDVREAVEGLVRDVLR